MKELEFNRVEFNKYDEYTDSQGKRSEDVLIIKNYIKELVERATPMKPFLSVLNGYKTYHCPICDNLVGIGELIVDNRPKEQNIKDKKYCILIKDENGIIQKIKMADIDITHKNNTSIVNFKKDIIFNMDSGDTISAWIICEYIENDEKITFEKLIEYNDTYSFPIGGTFEIKDKNIERTYEKYQYTYEIIRYINKE